MVFRIGAQLNLGGQAESATCEMRPLPCFMLIDLDGGVPYPYVTMDGLPPAVQRKEGGCVASARAELGELVCWQDSPIGHLMLFGLARPRYMF